MSDYDAAIIEEFRANAGRLGGSWEGRDLLLLTTTGRKSGRPHTKPMVYTRDGDRLLVYASKGGAPSHPDWYLNLQAKPEAEVEVEGARIVVRAVTVDDDRRERLWNLARDTWRYYDSYQQRTDRAIPVVRLQRIGG